MIVRQLKCSWCDLFYLAIDWLPWRVRGYCSDTCTPEARAKAKEKAMKKMGAEHGS